jgi:hypothetical protein
MPAYKISFEFFEDGEDTPTRDIVIVSDTYAALSNLDAAIEVDNDVFECSNTKTDLDGGSGEFIEDEMELHLFDPRAETEVDIACLNFIKAATNLSTLRFIGRTINPASTSSVAGEDFAFRGRIVSDMAGDDLVWRVQTEYDSNTNPLRNWNLTAASFDAGYLLDKALSSDDPDHPGLIEQIPGSWKSANIKDRLGYVKVNQPADFWRLACWGNLMPMGSMISELFRIASSDGITLTFNTTTSGFLGAPARFAPLLETDVPVIETVQTRYVNRFDSKGNIRPYEVLDDIIPGANDRYPLRLGGDGTQIGDILVSSKLLWPSQDESANSWLKYSSLRELIFTLASDVGAYPRFYYTGPNSLECEFVSRDALIATDLFIRDGIDASLQLRSQSRQGEKDRYVGVGTQFTREGEQVMYRYDGYGYVVARADYALPKNGTETALTISPHYCMLEHRGKDVISIGDTRGFSIIPHGVVFCSLDGSNNIIRDPNHPEVFPEYNRAVLHSAIYIVCPARADDFSVGITPGTNVVAPLARISMDVGGEIKTFEKISDLKNYIYDRDEAFYEAEYTITVPGLNCFRDAIDGENSWKHARAAARYVKDGVEYVVVGVQRNKVTTDLRCQLKDRFAFNAATDMDSIPLDGVSAPQGIDTPSYVPTSVIRQTAQLNEAVAKYDIVAWDGNLLVRAIPMDIWIGRIAGVALESGITGQEIAIQTTGRINMSEVDSSGVVGMVYVRHSDNLGIPNWSKTLLTEPTVDSFGAITENAVIPVGMFDAQGFLSLDFRNAIVLE